MKIGILAIQGSVAEHAESLARAGCEVVFVRKAKDLDVVSGLIIPGGESTTIGKLMAKNGLDKAIKEKVSSGMAVWGTCAGAILMARELDGQQTAETLGLMDIKVKRNAYGRQLDSFEGKLDFDRGEIDAVFIRAPKIVSIGKQVEVLAELNGEIVAVREGNLLATTFHPEMTDDLTVHRYFMEMARA